MPLLIICITDLQHHINPAFEPDDEPDEMCEASRRCDSADPGESGDPDRAKVQSGAERKYAVIRVTPATPSQSVDRSWPLTHQFYSVGFLTSMIIC